MNLEVEQLAIPKRKAEEQYQALVQAFRQNAKLRKEEIRQDLRRVYGHLRHGKKIIDVYESFKKAGLNEEGDPKLAICRADAKQCFCCKRDNGSAIFSMQTLNWQARYDSHSPRKTYNEILLPQGTFDFPKEYPTGTTPKNRYIQTIAPIIPAKILVTEVKALLKNFHIIWEVEEWKPVPPRDPILVKRLTPNLFGVLATWNLTKLERAVIRGRIQ